MTSNIPPKYDSIIEFKLKESLKLLKTFSKLKYNIKITRIINLMFYNELDKNFDDISLKLKELKLCDEYNYFLSISDYILYIVHQNSTDSKFGHYNFPVELLDFFMELFKASMNFYKSSTTNNEEFTTMQAQFEEQYWKYRSQFYCEIYQPTGDFTEEEMYEIHKSLRD